MYELTSNELICSFSHFLWICEYHWDDFRCGSLSESQLSDLNASNAFPLKEIGHKLFLIQFTTT
jgi:hypothetical protein